MFPLQQYSHSASVGSLYFLFSLEDKTSQNSTLSIQETSVTGNSSTSLIGFFIFIL